LKRGGVVQADPHPFQSRFCDAFFGCLTSWLVRSGPASPHKENVTTDSGRVSPYAPPFAPRRRNAWQQWELGGKIIAPARGPGRSMMGKLASGLLLTLVVFGSSTDAQAGPWCAFYDSSTYNCGFHSYAQCYATIYGNGGWCRQNFFEPSGRNRRSGKTRPPARF
jgi:Protein of unknown function (DUF3551)